MTGVTVHMRHVRAAKVCSRGSRAWCVAHDIDWSDFLTHGLPAETLAAFKDPIIDRVVAEAMKEHTRGR